MLSALLNLMALLIIFGVVMWLINSLIPMLPAIKTLLNVVVVVVLIIYVLQFFGLINVIFPVLTIFK